MCDHGDNGNDVYNDEDDGDDNEDNGDGNEDVGDDDADDNDTINHLDHMMLIRRRSLEYAVPSSL